MAKNHFPKTILVGSSLEEILKPTRGVPREYIFVQNLSAFDVYINFGSHADANNGFVLGAGLFYERDRHVPPDYIFVKGSQAGNNQQCQVVEG